jgi:hypothetical protein
MDTRRPASERFCPAGLAFDDADADAIEPDDAVGVSPITDS